MVLLLLIFCLMYFPLFIEFLCLSLFCYALLCVLSSFAIILRMNRELVALLLLSCGCLVAVRLFIKVIFESTSELCSFCALCVYK